MKQELKENLNLPSPEAFNGVLMKGRIERKDFSFSFISINGRIKELSGYPKKRFIDNDIRISDCIHPKDLKDIFLPSWKAILNQNKKNFEIEYRIIREDRSIKWIHSIVFNIEKFEKYTKFQSVIYDCTKKRKTLKTLSQSKKDLEKLTEDLQKSEEKYKLITENVNDIISLFDKNLNLLYINKNQKRISGFTKEEILGKSPLEFLHPNDIKHCIQIFQKAMREGYGEGEYRMRKKDGSFAWIEASGKKIIGGDGKEKIVLISREITEKKKAQQKLKHSEKKYRKIFYTSPVPLIEVHLYPIVNLKTKLTKLANEQDLNSNSNASSKIERELFQNFKILKVNERCLHLFKLKDQNQFIQNYPYYMKPVLLDILHKIGNQKKDKFKDLKFESKAENSLGKSIVLQVNLSKFSQSDNGLDLTIAMINITQRKSYEKNREQLLDQLINTLEFKSKFLASISHELRTPLNSILGFSELLLEELKQKLDVHQLEYVNDIHSSGEHLLNLINRLLDHSKLEADETSLDFKKLNLLNMVNNVKNSFKPLYSKKSLNFLIEGIKDNDTIKADPIRFKQILNNLISNAIKFTNEGYVAFKSIEKSDHWEFQVKDTGVGIAKENYDLIFREFGRINHFKSKEVQGTGIGLSLTKRIVLLHGGEIWFESELDNGSTFYFTIPKRL